MRQKGEIKFFRTSNMHFLIPVVKEVPQNANWIYSDLNMHRCLRNILKNVSFALRCHFATADMRFKDRIELHGTTLL